MAKIYQVPKLQNDGRSIPIYPMMDRPYRMQCCDCGLVHNIEFAVVKETSRHQDGSFDTEDVEDKSLRVEMVVGRNNRATGQVRRNRRKE